MYMCNIDRYAYMIIYVYIFIVITSCPAQVSRQSLAELAWPFPSTFQAQEGPIGEGGFRVTLVL